MQVEEQVVTEQLSSVEAYLREVSQMLEDDRPCQDILHQLNAIQHALGTASSKLLRIEIERCLQVIRDNPCPEQRCKELERLLSLYSLSNKLSIKVSETSSR